MHQCDATMGFAERAVYRKGLIEAALRTGKVALDQLTPRQCVPGAQMLGHRAGSLFEQRTAGRNVSAQHQVLTQAEQSPPRIGMFSENLFENRAGNLYLLSPQRQ